MKMTIAIQCHTNSEQINRLINYFQDDYIDIYIHVDKKSNIVSELDIKKNVYLIENRVDVKWGQFSQVEATLNIFKEIRNSDYKYKYIHLISGQDYPIKSLKAFKEYFLYQNSEFIECSPLPSDVLVKRGEDRYKVYYPNWMIDRPSKTFKRFIRILYREFILNIKIFERKNLDFENLYFGSQWFSITNSCMEYILDSLNNKNSIVRFFKNTLCSDEMFFQTIIMNSYFNKNVKNNNLRYIDWSDKKGSPKTLNIQDIKKAIKTDCFFARKIEDQSVIDYIEKSL